MPMPPEGIEFAADEPVIVTVRWFDAPRALVWAAWTEPAELATWWGPDGYTAPRVEVDLRPGGAWRIDMRGPDGTVQPGQGVYLEVVAPERLVWTDEVDPSDPAWAGQAPPSSVSTVRFDEIDGRTRLTITTRLATFGDRDRLIEHDWIDGFAQSFDRLVAMLAGAR